MTKNLTKNISEKIFNKSNEENIKIQFIGPKKVWKDYVANKIKERFEKKGARVKLIALGSYLKKESIKENPDWQHNNYLKRDFKYLKNNLNKNSYKKIKKTINKSWENLNKKEKLKIIEVTKNINNLETRTARQDYGDYIKAKTNNMAYLSEKILNNIKKLEKEYDLIMITDTRFLSELLVLSSVWFIPIKLQNDTLSLSTEFPHTSELELWLYNNKIWLELTTIDLEGKTNIAGAYRATGSLLEKKIDNILDISNKAKTYFNDEGVREYFKLQLNNLKYDNILSRVKKSYLELLSKFKRDDNNNSSFLNKENIKQKLRRSKQDYKHLKNNYIVKYNKIFKENF